jgi:hypothetical protein
VLVIEGNVDSRGAPGGDRTVAILRRLSWQNGDRFLRWTELDPYHALGNPARSVDVVAGRLVVRHAL